MVTIEIKEPAQQSTVVAGQAGTIHIAITEGTFDFPSDVVVTVRDQFGAVQYSKSVPFANLDAHADIVWPLATGKYHLEAYVEGQLGRRLAEASQDFFVQAKQS